MKEAKTVGIFPHVSADGDALGSSLALGLVLESMSKSVEIVLEEDIPYIYGFLPGIRLTSVYAAGTKYYDVAVALDTGDTGRLGKRAGLFENAGVTVNIDHHHTNSEYAFYNYVHATSSSVGEIIYQMIKMMGAELGPDVSTCLYVAIATDTGGFKFSNTTSITHQIAGDLINNGVDVAEVSRRVFDTVSYEKVKLMGAAIGTLELLEKGKLAFITVTDEMMRSVGAREEDCEGIVNLGRNIKGVEVAVMLRQRDNGEIKVNLRSNSYVDVSAIAGMYSGGGHKRAAGCIVNKDMAELKKMLQNDIKEAL